MPIKIGNRVYNPVGKQYGSDLGEIKDKLMDRYIVTEGVTGKKDFLRVYRKDNAFDVPKEVIAPYGNGYGPYKLAS